MTATVEYMDLPAWFVVTACDEVWQAAARAVVPLKVNVFAPECPFFVDRQNRESFVAELWAAGVSLVPRAPQGVRR